ncbi:MAG: hypothetical protein JRN52_06860 [Nitrososphaerota archaeon]|nr:hypothetical protein [Nitrososphaerota archaeon]
MGGGSTNTCDPAETNTVISTKRKALIALGLSVAGVGIQIGATLWFLLIFMVISRYSFGMTSWYYDKIFGGFYEPSMMGGFYYPLSPWWFLLMSSIFITIMSIVIGFGVLGIFSLNSGNSQGQERIYFGLDSGINFIPDNVGFWNWHDPHAGRSCSGL